MSEKITSGTTTSLDGAAGTIRRTVLPGGLRIVTETMPTVRSVAVGIWANVGSRDEDTLHGGASHFLEHLLFKGTARRDAMRIAAEMDAVGGVTNAFTAKEFTCYYARVLDTDLPLAVDVLADMVTSSLLTPPDVEAERGVILEEIAMYDDDPSDTVHDEFALDLFGDTPLGRPILGTTESINAISADRIHEYYRQRYLPSNLVVSVAGNIDHEVVVELVAAAFDQAAALGEPDAQPTPPRIGGPGVDVRSGARLISDDTEQANLVLGTLGLRRTDDRRFTLNVLDAAFGGGSSSRLFQEIREKRGMAYAVSSFSGQYADTGLFGVYVGCLPNKIDDVLKICREELDKMIADGLTEEELARGKGQLRGSFVLGLEDTGSRMSRIAKSELVYGELMGVDEVLSRIDSVTLDDIRAVARDVIGGPKTLTVIGPYTDRDFTPIVA